MLTKLWGGVFTEAANDLAVKIMFSGAEAALLLTESVWAQLGLSVIEDITNAAISGANEDDIIDMIKDKVGTLTDDEIGKVLEMVKDFVKNKLGNALGPGRIVTRGTQDEVSGRKGDPVQSTDSIECVFFVQAEVTTGLTRLWGLLGEDPTNWRIFGSCKYTCDPQKTPGARVNEACPCGCNGTLVIDGSGSVDKRARMKFDKNIVRLLPRP